MYNVHVSGKPACCCMTSCFLFFHLFHVQITTAMELDENGWTPKRIGFGKSKENISRENDWKIVSAEIFKVTWISQKFLFSETIFRLKFRVASQFNIVFEITCWIIVHPRGFFSYRCVHLNTNSSREIFELRGNMIDILGWLVRPLTNNFMANTTNSYSIFELMDGNHISVLVAYWFIELMPINSITNNSPKWNRLLHLQMCLIFE